MGTTPLIKAKRVGIPGIQNPVRASIAKQTKDTKTKQANGTNCKALWISMF
jgi:hypothetical protein